MKLNFLLGFVFILFSQNIFAQTQGELLIFVQEEKSISQNLISEDLSAIKAMAKSQNIEVKMVNIEDAAPEEIDFTPTIIFQNHLGRSVYKGRYNALDRLTNFVRTAQWEASELTNYSKEDILYFQRGQAVLASPIKITNLEGDLPKRFDFSEFQMTAKAAVIRGMSRFEYKTISVLTAQARLFYMDFYPYRNEANELFISMRVYSGFSCVAPVFESKTPIRGSFDDFESLFEEAGAHLEEAVLAQINIVKYGDGIEPLPENLDTISFEKLGFPLPKSDLTNQSIISNNIEVSSQKWVFEKGISASAPVLQFQFPAPLDQYSGEAKKMEMRLNLAEKNSLRHATGKVEVAAKSVTMGDAALDDHILNEYILAGNFPVASYDFEITNAPEKLKSGEAQPVELTGIFQMKGIEVELPATGTVELIANESGEPRLHVKGQFDLKLKALFGIKGPDGPKKASDLLQFRLNFLVRPVTEFPDENAFRKTAENYSEQTQNGLAETTFGNEFGTINWQASTKVYKADGYFKDWHFTHLNIPDNDLEKMEAAFEIDLNSVWEKSKLLVKHVKSDKFFEVEKYPIAKIEIKGSNRQNDGTYSGKAMVKIKDISAIVPFNFEVLSESPLTINGTCEIPRKTFKIGKVKKKGGVSKMVKVEMEVVLEEGVFAMSDE